MSLPNQLELSRAHTPRVASALISYLRPLQQCLLATITCHTRAVLCMYKEHVAK